MCVCVLLTRILTTFNHFTGARFGFLEHCIRRKYSNNGMTEKLELSFSPHCFYQSIFVQSDQTDLQVNKAIHIGYVEGYEIMNLFLSSLTLATYLSLSR